MNTYVRRRIAILALLSFMALGAGWTYVFAADATSSHFMSLNANVNQLGGISTSSAFTSIQTLGQAANGPSTSTSFLLDSGFLYFDTFTPNSKSWRWYDDEEHETPTSPFAAENTAPSNIQDLNRIKLRIAVPETASIGQSAAKFRLQYSTSSDFSSNVFSLIERSNCQPNSGWCYADGAGLDNGVISTGLISDSDSCVAGVGDGCGTHNESGTSTSSFTHKKNAVTEYEFTLQSSGSIANTVYFFRLFDTVSSSSVPLFPGATYPSLSTTGATLTFTIDGLATSTVTEGVTTDVETSSTGVPFGAVPINTPRTAAQRLTVTTNAGQGYEVYAYGTQGLVNVYNSEIPPVTASNSAPADWTSACVVSSSGCYGYHTGEDVLFGGSTRFAPDDTYAPFTSNPDEIAYSSGPISNKTIDMVYKLEAHSLQEAGDYTTNIVYIVVPTF